MAPENTPQQKTETTKKSSSRIEKIKQNKSLFSILFLVILIVIAAIGVGVYSLLNRDNPNTNQTTDESTQVALIDGESNEPSQDETTGTDSLVTEENTIEEIDNSVIDNQEDTIEDIEVSETPTEGENESPEQSEQSSNEEITEESGTINGNGASTSAGNALSTGHTQAGYNKSRQTEQNILATGVWKATDYTKGDIEESPYTVQLGDTLWEIAEGYYGDGFQWTAIKDANPSLVQLLPNGTWALITPGAVLQFP